MAHPLMILITMSGLMFLPARAMETPSAFPPKGPTSDASDESDEKSDQEASADSAKRSLADEDEVEELLELYERALETELSTQLLEVLQAMQAFRNEEFIDPALDSLDYRATRKDIDAIIEIAKANDIGSKEHVEQMVVQDENRVRIEGARLLANFPEPKYAKQLLRRAQSRALRDRPELAGTFIEAIGWMKEPRSENEIYRLFKKSNDDKHLLRGCVRYFGLLPTRRYDIAREMALRMDPPNRPRNNEDQGDRAVNPMILWRTQMEIFNFIKRDLSKALGVITGQEFRPTDKGALDALQYLQDHRRRLRLR